MMESMSLRAFLTWPHYFRQREVEKTRPAGLMTSDTDQVISILERHRPRIRG